MPTTKLQIGAAPCVIQLNVVEALAGVQSSAIRLASPDAKWDLRLPREAFKNMTTESGDMILASITLVKIATYEEETPAFDAPGLLLPRAN